MMLKWNDREEYAPYRSLEVFATRISLGRIRRKNSTAYIHFVYLWRQVTVERPPSAPPNLMQRVDANHETRLQRARRQTSATALVCSAISAAMMFVERRG